MYHIAICDDDVLYLDNILSKITELFNNCKQTVQADTFNNTSDLLEAVQTGSCYKLVFLDIQFPKSNGVDAARKIKSISPDTDFIFLSSTSDYALESFDVAPLYYIKKPEDDSKLAEAVKRFLRKNSANKITIKTSNKVV